MTRTPTDRCLICGSTGPIDRHHIARAVNLTVTVPLCRTHHRRVWDHETTAGVHRPGGTDVQRAWAILHGFLALGAVSTGRWTAQTTNLRGALLAVLCSLTDQPIGPNPTTAATRRGEQDHDPQGDPGTREQFARGLLTAMSHAISEWLGDEQLAAVAAQLADVAHLDVEDMRTAERLATEATTVLGRLADLDDRTALDDELTQRVGSLIAATRGLLQRMVA